MPAVGSRDLIFRRNLFSKIRVADGLVQESYNEGLFNGMVSHDPRDPRDPPATEYNWSDRAAPAAPQTGEINRLFAQNGKRGEKGFAFASTETKDPKFLAPTDKSVQRKVDLSADPKTKLPFEKPWVGAIGP